MTQHIKKEATNMEKLGKKAQDKITGFEGIIIGRVDYLFGCTQYSLAPKAKDGEVKEAAWFDEGRIEIIGDGVTQADVTADKPGGVHSGNPRVY